MALADNLIAYWSLDEASGNAIDAHGSNDLTETSGTIASTTGKVGNCRDFEAGDTEYFSIADNTDLSVGDIDFTFALWVNLESLGTPAVFYPQIITKDNLTVQHEYGLIVNPDDSNQFFFFVSADGSAVVSVTATSLGTPSTGTWYFVVVWHDAIANTINISVNNGSVDSQAHSTGVINGTQDFMLGAFKHASTATQYFDGLLDEVGFWKRVLTADERTELYNAGAGRDYDYIINGPLAGNVLLLQDGSPFLLQDGSRLLLQEEEITEGSPNARRFGKKPFGVQGIRIY